MKRELMVVVKFEYEDHDITEGEIEMLLADGAEKAVSRLLDETGNDDGDTIFLEVKEVWRQG